MKNKELLLALAEALDEFDSGVSASILLNGGSIRDGIAGSINAVTAKLRELAAVTEEPETVVGPLKLADTIRDAQRYRKIRQQYSDGTLFLSAISDAAGLDTAVDALP